MNHQNKAAPSTGKKSDREALELRIDLKLAEAKQELTASNKAELQKLAESNHEPKLKKLRNFSALIIAGLVVSNLWAFLGIKDRVAKEAERVIDQKLIDPQLTNTLNEALAKKAIPFISTQLRPLETNAMALATNLKQQSNLFRSMSFEISKRQTQLSFAQEATHKSFDLLSTQLVTLQASMSVALEKQKGLEDEQKLTELLTRAELFDRDALQGLQEIAASTNENHKIATLARLMRDKLDRTFLVPRCL
jgi:hypothetical protein